MEIYVAEGWAVIGEAPVRLVDAKSQTLNSQTLDMSCNNFTFRKEVIDAPFALTVTSPNSVPCKRISITSNARFFEIYSINDKQEEVYVATCRGNTITKNMFECIYDTPLAISAVKLKFLSLKPLSGDAGADFALQHLSLHVRDQTAAPPLAQKSPLPPVPSPTHSSMDGLLLMLPMLKASILSDVSNLLDAKLSPLYHKLHRMETSIQSLESSIQTLTAQYPAYNTLSSENHELNHSISFVEHDDMSGEDGDESDKREADIQDEPDVLVEKCDDVGNDAALKQDMRALLCLLKTTEELEVSNV